MTVINKCRSADENLQQVHGRFQSHYKCFRTMYVLLLDSNTISYTCALHAMMAPYLFHDN